MANLNKYKNLNPNDVRKIIKSFFISNPSYSVNLNINDNVVDVVWVMVSETKKCTKVLNLVPRPSGGVPGAAYVVLQLGTLAKRLTKDKELISDSCRSAALYRYSTILQMASAGG